MFIQLDTQQQKKLNLLLEVFILTLFSITKGLSQDSIIVKGRIMKNLSYPFQVH